jgi:hypothetical protein
MLAVACGLVFSSFLASPGSAANENAALVLHAIPYQIGNTCDTPAGQGFDCRSRGATVQVTAAAEIDLYLYVYDFDDVAGVQCKLVWPADWVFSGWRGCGRNQLSVIEPSASDGSLITAFDAVSGSAGVTPVGRLSMTAGSSGCASIGASDQPGGTSVIDSGFVQTGLNPARWGSVCAGTSGIDSCNPGPPLPESSWGKIKASYGN